MTQASNEEDSEALRVVHQLVVAYYKGGEEFLVQKLFEIQQELEMRDWNL